MAELQSKSSASNRLLGSISSDPYNVAKSVPQVTNGTQAKPVAIGPQPTPPLQKGVSATPQYSGSDMFSTYKPITYTDTPQGQAEVARINSGLPAPKVQPTTTQQIPSNQAKSTGPSDLVSALVGKGYSLVDAQNAANGPDADRLRKEYITAAPSGPSKEDISAKYTEKTGLDIDPTLLDKLKGDSDNGADIDALINQIESEQRGAATEEYMASMDVLGKQKGELGSMAEYQKGKISKQLGLDKEEIQTNKLSDEASIKKQEERFTQENDANKDLIAANWRDLSLKTQAIARARGITSSDFAAQIESKQAMELNKGLRVLATNAQNVYSDFIQALSDSNSFYANADKKLTSDAQTRSDDVDQWLQGEVSKIQSLERVALGTKLSQIKSAAAEASKLKLGIAQQAETRRQNLEDWLMQTKVNFDNSLKLAAQGNVAKASDKIKEQTAYFNMIKTGLQSGALGMTSSNEGAKIVGSLPFLTGNDKFSSIQTTPEAYNAYQTSLKQADPLKQLQGGLIGGIGFNPDETNY